MARTSTARKRRNPASARGTAAPARRPGQVRPSAAQAARRGAAPAKKGTARRGFASMSPARVREVAARGGKKTAQGHDMAMIGQSGGQVTAQRGSEYFARIGRLGGRAGKRGKAKQT